LAAFLAAFGLLWWRKEVSRRVFTRVEGKGVGSPRLSRFESQNTVTGRSDDWVALRELASSDIPQKTAGLAWPKYPFLRPSPGSPFGLSSTQRFGPTIITASGGMLGRACSQVSASRHFQHLKHPYFLGRQTRNLLLRFSVDTRSQIHLLPGPKERMYTMQRMTSKSKRP
jgi:hypothetical protein